MVNLIQGAKTTSRDQLDYDNDKCTILSVAFQREKEVWKPWLEKTLVGYFHQFLLRNWFNLSFCAAGKFLPREANFYREKAPDKSLKVRIIMKKCQKVPWITSYQK